MAFTTLPPAGAKLPASTLASLITEVRPISAFKSASTSRASTIVRVADPDLVIALPANTTWDFDMILQLRGAANAAGDFSGEFSFPASSVVSYTAHGLVDTLASGQSADLQADASGGRDAASPTNSFDFGVSTSFTSVLVSGRIELGATAGSLSFNWAQQSSNVNATIVEAGSRLIATRVS